MAYQQQANNDLDKLFDFLSEGVINLSDQINTLYLKNKNASIRNVHYTVFLPYLKSRLQTNNFNINLLSSSEKTLINNITDNSTAMFLFCTLLFSSKELCNITKQKFRSVKPIIELVDFCGAIAEKSIVNPRCKLSTDITEAAKVLMVLDHISTIHYFN